MRHKTCYQIILAIFTGLIIMESTNADVFNTAPSAGPPALTDFYGAPMAVHSPDYYNSMIADKNNQTYQALLDSNKAKANDPELKALQEKMLMHSSGPTLLTNNPTTTPPVQPATPQITAPQSQTIYQTPVTSNNNSATNLNNNTTNSNNSAGNNSNSSSLDIQY